ncbi:MAG: NAD(P)H-binding protein [Haliangiales bacterium]
MAKIAIAGASGFVGRALIPQLRRHHDLIALSRTPAPPELASDGLGAVEWRACDLFSLLDAERGLAGAELVIYLVHSMLPSAHLTQGSFQDMDLIVADNVARAARAAGVRQIIYLGGLIPTTGELSEHLASRLEVEATLAASVPTTSLRAGLIIGPDGSSTQMMVRLVRRLPMMACPRWTQTQTQPIALADVVALIDYLTTHSEHHIESGGQHFDIGAPETLTYRDMMAMVAEELGLRRPMLPVPLLSPGLSRLWVSIITGAPRALVKPLIRSLSHPMVAKDRRLQELAGVPGVPTRVALRQALSDQAVDIPPRAYRSTPDPTPARDPSDEPAEPSRGHDYPTVRSVQRLPRPPDATAEWVANAYVRWLPRALNPWLRVKSLPDGHIEFSLLGLSRPLLRLFRDPERSRDDRPLFYIRGGLLARTMGRGRLEFRQTPASEHVLAAIHDYPPRLPWFLYRYSQAKVHLLVMRAFGRWLARAQVERPSDDEGQRDNQRSAA